MPENKIIVEAVLTPDNKIEVRCLSNHVPSLSYISKIIDAYIIEQITIQKIKQEIKDAPKIIVPDNHKGKDMLHNVIDFVRKRS